MPLLRCVPAAINRLERRLERPGCSDSILFQYSVAPVCVAKRPTSEAPLVGEQLGAVRVKINEILQSSSTAFLRCILRCRSAPRAPSALAFLPESGAAPRAAAPSPPARPASAAPRPCQTALPRRAAAPQRGPERPPARCRPPLRPAAAPPPSRAPSRRPGSELGARVRQERVRVREARPPCRHLAPGPASGHGGSLWGPRMRCVRRRGRAPHLVRCDDGVEAVRDGEDGAARRRWSGWRAAAPCQRRGPERSSPRP